MSIITQAIIGITIMVILTAVGLIYVIWWDR